jgi:hypothetical protein
MEEEMTPQPGAKWILRAGSGLQASATVAEPGPLI